MLYTKPMNNNRDFCRLYARAKSLAHPLLVTYVSPNKLGYNRLGITTSKKIGNAVKRNRARRIIKQAYFETEQEMGRGFDVVLVARGRTVDAKSTQLLPVLRGQAKKLGLIASEKV